MQHYTSPTGFSAISMVKVSSDPYANGLLYGTKWGGELGSAATITYSFPGSGSSWSADTNLGYGASSGAGYPWHSQGLSSAEQATFRVILQTWANVANLNFVEVADTSTSVGDIRVAWSSTLPADAAGLAYSPAESPRDGDIWLNSTSSFARIAGTFNPGKFGYFTLLHEIGHALGLKHPFEGSAFNLVQLPWQQDVWHQTVMSYSGLASPTLPTVTNPWEYMPTTPMPLDIAAMQYLYGPNMSYHAGNDSYQFSQYDSSNSGNSLSPNQYFMTIWDAGGTDSIEYTGDNWCEIDLRPGNWSHLGDSIDLADGSNSTYYTVCIYQTVTIENATGGNGNDTIYGNAVANLLQGRGGNDVIDGGSGVDTAVYSSARAGYAAVKSGTVWTVANTMGSEGTDSLLSVERVRFSDGTLALDTGNWETSGEAYRLYQAAFGRTPDTGGLKYWVAQLDGGQTLEQVSHNFMVSAEFKTLYGANPSHGDQVTAMYRNVLGRSPDQGGYGYWLDLLDRGQIAPEQMLINFSESGENLALVGTAIQNGIWLGS